MSKNCNKPVHSVERSRQKQSPLPPPIRIANTQVRSAFTKDTPKNKNSNHHSNNNRKKDSRACIAASTRLLEILTEIRDPFGRGLLHQISHDTTGCLLKLSQVLLQRAAFLSSCHDQTDFLSSSSSSSSLSAAAATVASTTTTRSCTWIEQFTGQPDFPSGYTPLHYAIFHRSISAILTLLRSTEARFLQNPMQLLSTKTNQTKDYEGFTPFRLLSEMQVENLTKIRLTFLKPYVVPSLKTDRATRHQFSSYSVCLSECPAEYKGMLQTHHEQRYDNDGDEDEYELVVYPYQNRFAIQPIQKYGCEVMTFGAAHHPALGVSDTTKHSHDTNCPQRILEFAPNHGGAAGRTNNNNAIQVAAASHHSLILTQQGHVYACGLGKGGRLGTGHEQNTLTPMRILGALTKVHVTFVAAAENHSMCVTQTGNVFCWGSNRFGQLGILMPSSISNSSSCNAFRDNNTSRFSPTRVVDLIKHPCIAVAAGEKHSVALTRDGEVYTWGDNSSCQLGRQTRKKDVQRVDALWSNGERIAIQVNASDKSTLALVAPSDRGPQVNSIFMWGYGNSIPIKVTFEVEGALQYVDPIEIACARHHNVAVSKHGKVYTFGVNSETLASKRSSSLVVASPVTGMYPENGGGFAVAVSASDHHTAIVTAQGHLFTWGSTIDKDVMGHEGLRWQPSPKRVEGVYRAVSVAVAKEHTLLLCGTFFPGIPRKSPDSTLEALAARCVCKHVDMFNVIPIAIVAERIQCCALQSYCDEFIRENLDGVLAFSRKSELDVYLNEQLAECRVSDDRDESVHPLVVETAMVNKSNADWLEQCVSILDSLPLSTLVKYQRRNRRRASSFREKSEVDDLAQHLQTGHHGCSEKCHSLTSNLSILVTKEQLRNKHDCLSREIRGIKKRLTQIEKLQTKESLSSAEREKLNRKPLLDADLSQLLSALERVEKKMCERNMELNSTTSSSATVSLPDTPPVQRDEASVFKCDVCDVSCPDDLHLELHLNGRKHRNRMKQAEEIEKDRVAKAIVEEKKQQAPELGVSLGARQLLRSPLTPEPSAQPRYHLSPPYVPSGSAVVDTAECYESCSTTLLDRTSSSWPTNHMTPKAKSLRSILVEEESQKMKRPPAPQKSSRKLISSPSKSPPPGGTHANRGAMPSLQNPRWTPTPAVRVCDDPLKVLSVTTSSAPILRKKTITTPSSGTKQSLSEFLKGPKPCQKPPRSVLAPWAPKCSTSVPPLEFLSSVTVAEEHGATKEQRAVPGTCPSQSLLEIQKQEEEIAKRERKNAAKEARWYIGNEGRAESFAFIQEMDVLEKKMRSEQRDIERQIQQDEELAKRIFEQEQRQQLRHPTHSKKSNPKRIHG